VTSAHISDFTAPAPRAPDSARVISARVRSAAAQVAELRHILASYPAPSMPPELGARIEGALAAEAAKSKSMSLSGPRSRPGPMIARDEWLNRNILIAAPQPAVYAT